MVPWTLGREEGLGEEKRMLGRGRYLWFTLEFDEDAYHLRCFAPLLMQKMLYPFKFASCSGGTSSVRVTFV